MSKVELREAKRGDEKILAYIQSESWKSAFKDILSTEELKKCCDVSMAEGMYKEVLKQGQVHMWIEWVDGEPHCISGWSRNRNMLADNVAELICIHSLANQHHQGFGSIMMEHILKQMKGMGYKQVILWVFEENHKARSFYEKHGFVVSECRNQAHGAIEVMYSKKL